MIAAATINAAQKRFASYYLTQLQAISRAFARGGEHRSYGLQRFDADYPQIEHVLTWLADNCQTDDETASIFTRLLEVGHPVFVKRLPAEKLLSLYRQALPVAQAFQDAGAVMSVQLAIANAHLAMNHVVEALEFLNRTVAFAEQIGDRARLAQCLYDLSFVYSELSQENEAIEKANQALDLYRKLNDRQNEGRCLFRLAQIMLRIGEWDTANSYLSKAYEIATQHDNQTHTHSVLVKLGELRERQGNLVEALAHKTRALAMAQESGSQSEIVFDLLGLGITHDLTRDFSTAQDYYRQGLKIARKMGFERQKSLLLGNLGYSAYMQGEFSTAAGYMEESLKMVQVANQKSMVCVTLANLVAVYIGLGDRQEAHRSVSEGLDLALSLQNKQLEVMMFVAAVQFYVFESLRLNDPTEQREIMSKAVRCAGFIYSSAYADQENRGELDALHPQMERVLEPETVLYLLSEGAQMQLETVYEQVVPEMSVIG